MYLNKIWVVVVVVVIGDGGGHGSSSINNSIAIITCATRWKRDQLLNT